MSSAEFNTYKSLANQTSEVASQQSTSSSKALPTRFINSTQLATNIIAALSISESTLKNNNFNEKLAREINKIDIYSFGSGNFENKMKKSISAIQAQAKKLLKQDSKDQVAKESKIDYPAYMKIQINDKREREIGEKMAMIEETLRDRSKL